MDTISLTGPCNSVACVQGVPAHLNICLIRKVNLFLLPAITPCAAKPNINASAVTHRRGLSPPTSVPPVAWTTQRWPNHVSSLSVLCSLTKARLCHVEQKRRWPRTLLRARGVRWHKGNKGLCEPKRGEIEWSCKHVDQVLYPEDGITSNPTRKCSKATLGKQKRVLMYVSFTPPSVSSPHE